MLGKLIIAYFLTLRFGSSPSDLNYNPMNCSHKSFPNSAAILLKSCTATTLFYSLASSWAISKTYFNTLSPLLSPSIRYATFDKQFPASSLMSNGGNCNILTINGIICFLSLASPFSRPEKYFINPGICANNALWTSSLSCTYINIVIPSPQTAYPKTLSHPHEALPK